MGIWGLSHCFWGRRGVILQTGNAPGAPFGRAFRRFRTLLGAFGLGRDATASLKLAAPPKRLRTQEGRGGAHPFGARGGGRAGRRRNHPKTNAAVAGGNGGCYQRNQSYQSHLRNRNRGRRRAGGEATGTARGREDAETRTRQGGRGGDGTRRRGAAGARRRGAAETRGLGAGERTRAC